MAAAKCRVPPPGFTRYVGQSGLTAPGPSGIILTSPDGNDWGIAVRNDGDVVVLDGDDLNNAALAIGSDGDVIGGQS